MNIWVTQWVHTQYEKQQCSLYIILVNKTATMESIFYTGIHLYNLLPLNIRNSNKLNTFKVKAQLHFSEQIYRIHLNCEVLGDNKMLIGLVTNL